MSTINVYKAIKDIRYFLSYLPEVGETTIFNLGYGRLKIWQFTDDNYWIGFLLPYKKQPTLDNLLHLSKDEIYEIACTNL